jgi:hypothetical protein
MTVLDRIRLTDGLADVEGPPKGGLSSLETRSDDGDLWYGFAPSGGKSVPAITRSRLRHHGSTLGDLMVTDTTTTEERPANRSDLLVSRGLGLGIIVIGVVLAYSFIFTTFEQRVTFQWEFVNGERTPITHVTCPAPWSVLNEGARPQGVVTGDLCVKPARGQVVQGIGVAIAALAVGGWILTRDPRRKPLPPLPPSVRAMRWKR